MAPKSQTRLVDQPPSASSSEDEEESDPEEETQNSEEESEEEEEEAPKKAPEQPPKNLTVQKPQSSSGSESESDEEESDSSQHPQPSPSVSDFTIKPSLPCNAPKPPAKRPPETPVRESARKKLKSGEEDGNVEEKKVPGSATAAFARVWSENDEITVLEGMVDYKAQKGLDPSADMSAFHEFIKGKLHADISRTQMYEKIRRLKKKFFNNIERGDTPDFPKPHDYKTFEASKKVWGSSAVNNGVNENTKSPNNGKPKKAAEIKKTSEPKKGAKAINLFPVTKEEEKEKPVITKEKDTGISAKDEGDFKSKYPRLVESFNKGNITVSEEALALIRENISLIGSSKAEEFEEQWTKILKEEAELFLKMTDLMGEQIKLILESIKR